MREEEFYTFLREGALKGERDAIRKLCEHDDGSLVSEAIHALAKVNEKVALEQAKERLRLYATKAIPKEDFWWWYVMPYLDLFLCFEDRSAIADMNEVLKRLGTERDREEEIKLIEILLRFLKAEGAEDRAKLAVEFIRNDRVDPFFRKKLADRLIEEGAPPERLKELMADPIR